MSAIIKAMQNIRSFKNSDARFLAKMLGFEWDLAKCATGAGRLCDWVYLAEILAENTKMLVMTDKKGCPIGFAGYVQYKSNRHMFRRVLWRFAHFVLCLCIKNRAALRKYYDVYNYAPQNIVHSFDAECDILIVDKDYRGGAGRKLFVALMQKAAERGIKEIRIDTDDSCNVGFYRCIGAKQIYCGVAKSGGEEHTKKVYVFYADPHKFINS